MSDRPKFTVTGLARCMRIRTFSETDVMQLRVALMKIMLVSRWAALKIIWVQYLVPAMETIGSIVTFSECSAPIFFARYQFPCSSHTTANK